MTTALPSPRRSLPATRVLVDDPHEGLLVIRVGAWHLEVVDVAGVPLARWWAPSGEFFEVPVGRA